MKKTKERPIEVAMLYADRTWDTVIVEIPADTPEDEIAEASYLEAVAHIPGHHILSMTAIYNTMEDHRDATEKG